MSKSYFKIRELIEAVVDNNMPVAISEPHVNSANKSAAIQSFLYGPVMPFADNTEYYEAVAKEMNMSPNDVQGARCANCAYFNNTPEIQQFIAMGMGGEQSVNPLMSIQKGGLGYCQNLHFIAQTISGCTQWIAAVEDQQQ